MKAGSSDMNKKKSEFESPYRHYKISTALKPIGFDNSGGQTIANRNFKGQSKYSIKLIIFAIEI